MAGVWAAFAWFEVVIESGFGTEPSQVACRTIQNATRPPCRNELSELPRFVGYAAEFEKAFESDDWALLDRDLLRPHVGLVVLSVRIRLMAAAISNRLGLA